MSWLDEIDEDEVQTTVYAVVVTDHRGVTSLVVDQVDRSDYRPAVYLSEAAAEGRAAQMRPSFPNLTYTVVAHDFGVTTGGSHG